MKTAIRTFWIALLLPLAPCGCGDLDVPDYNNGSLEELSLHPTRAMVLSAATGLLIGSRVDMAEPNGYVAMLGILGREAYNFDPADPRFINEMLDGPLDPGSPRFGGNFWVQPYSNIRNANTLLQALERVRELSLEEKEATRGLVKTIEALDYLVLINTHDKNGAPIALWEGRERLAPIASKAEVFLHIGALLDEGADHLLAGGEAFAFPLSSGFRGFDSPASFLRFNRALRARIEVYQGRFQEALDALAGSFLHVDPADPQLALGVYHVYQTGPGDALNGLNSPNLFAHPSVAADAEKKGDGTPDDRLQQKVARVEPLTVQELTSDLRYTLYREITAPLPIIRNEELVLLRAEANLGLGDVAQAIADINYIRTVSGGLPARADLTPSNALDELLRQRRYSLLFEGGHRWIDLRRYGKLGELPLDQPSHTVPEAYPIPIQETDARKGS